MVLPQPQGTLIIPPRDLVLNGPSEQLFKKLFIIGSCLSRKPPLKDTSISNPFVNLTLSGSPNSLKPICLGIYSFFTLSK